MPCPLHQSDEGERQRGHHQQRDQPEQRGFGQGQRAGDDSQIVEGGDVDPSERGCGSRGNDDPDHQSQRSEPGALKEEDQRNRGGSDREGLEVELRGVQEGVEGAEDTIGSLRLVAGEVGKLPKDDVDADRAQEPDHDRVGHKPQDRTEPEEPRREHDDAGEHREGEQGTRRIAGVMDRWDVGHDHGHCARGLDSHERRAGKERAGDRPDHVRVQARERVDPGKDPGGEAVGDTFHAKHQARDRVLTQRVSPDREAELHLEGSSGGRPSDMAREWHGQPRPSGPVRPPTLRRAQAPGSCAPRGQGRAHAMTWAPPAGWTAGTGRATAPGVAVP